MKSIRLGLMGFGQIGRQIYKLAAAGDKFEIVAISDPGRPEVLCHLLSKTMRGDGEVILNGKHLQSGDNKARMLTAVSPADVPWDLFDIDFAIDLTGRFRRLGQLTPHLDNGAGRVILSTLPESDIDRVILSGINDRTAVTSDRIISAGSASTTAAALAINTLLANFRINHVSMTSVHAYTSDQMLQDYVSNDYRRSRSGAENIIPNITPALTWIPRVLPALEGKFSAYALNVPVQTGSMVDLTFSLRNSDVSAAAVNDLFIDAARQLPRHIETVEDPVVSSDVKGSSKSLVVDLQATMKAADHTVKIIGWHETLGHARRILDVVELYANLDASIKREVA